MLIRRLNVDDIHHYKKIRLRLLKLAPTNFGSSYEEESNFEDEMWIKRLNNKNATTLGAFIDNEIKGIVVVMENPRKKMKHKASIHSMFVEPDQRGKGIAKKLLLEAFAYLKSRNVLRVNLSVVSTNTSAKKLYESLGFEVYGEEEDAILLDNTFHHLILMTKVL